MKEQYKIFREAFIDIACTFGILTFQFVDIPTIAIKSFINIALFPMNIYFFGHLLYSFIKIVKLKGE